jgi:hypothetical protein
MISNYAKLHRSILEQASGIMRTRAAAEISDDPTVHCPMACLWAGWSGVAAVDRERWSDGLLVLWLAAGAADDSAGSWAADQMDWSSEH